MHCLKRLYFLVLVLCSQSALTQSVETIVQRNGGNECRDFTISSDGLLLAKVSQSLVNTDIEIWNTKTGHLLRVISPQSSGTPGNSFINAVQTVRFYRGSSQIITGTTDGEHEIYDVSTGKLVRKLPFKTHIQGLFAVSRTGVMAAVHIMGVVSPNSLLLADVFSNTVIDSLQLKTSAITALEFSPKGDALAVGTKDGKVHIFNYPGFDSSRIIQDIHDTAISFLQWTDDNYLLVTDSKIFTLWNMTTAKMQSNGYLRNGKKMISDPKEDTFYELVGNALIKRTGSGVVQRVFGVNTDKVLQMAMDSQQKRLYILTDKFVRVWDLEHLLQTDCISKELFAKNASDKEFALLPDARNAIFRVGNRIMIKPIDSAASTKEILTDTAHWNNFKAYKNNLPVVSANGRFIIWDDTTRQTIIKSGSPHELILAADEKSGRIIASGKGDSVVRFYEPSKGIIKQVKLGKGIDCAAVSSSGNLVAIGGNSLFLVSSDNQAPIRLFDRKKETAYTNAFDASSSFEMPGLYTKLLFSPGGEKLYALSKWTGLLKVWDIRSKQIDTALTLSIDDITLSPDGKRLFASSDNQVFWIQTSNFKIEANTTFLTSGDHITQLANFQYKASANGSKAVAFRKGLQTYGFDQFDLQYNRPDLVTRQLGNPSPQMQRTLDQLMAKRWQRLNYSPDRGASQLVEAPEVTIRNLRSIPGTVTQRKLSFVTELNDKQTPLARVNILINGVPSLEDRNGILIQPDTSYHKQGNINFSIYLDPGNNVVEVYCTNRKGIESQKESFEVFYNADTGSIRSTTYFIGIGAGKYEQETFDLKYPEKDVNDVAGLLQTLSKKSNTALRIKLLTNEQVTTQNIKALKQMLDSSSIDDKVIICWSGHGLLDKSLDYYLATYNTDFSNPSANALNYTQLADLLENIPARKRVLFLDACHSGELDREESSLDSGNGPTGGSGAKSTIKKSGLRNTPAMLNEFFADVRRNSGANIISAAGGAEYALESDAWQNGVFTFCLLDGLGNRVADLNNDRQISIRELQSFLQQKVPELTQGRQKPTSRTENLVSDWIIF
jgi:WD40 repeat protein